MTKKYMHNIPEGVTLWVSCTLQLRDIRLAETELIENNWQIKLPDKGVLHTHSYCSGHILMRVIGL